MSMSYPTPKARSWSRKQRRIGLIVAVGVILAIAAALVLTALEDTIVFFRTPTELASGEVPSGVRVRIGGLVEAGSVDKSRQTTILFKVTDTASSVPVTYTGVLPDLFREGQGVVAEGSLTPDGLFKADTVLARHDENYMPTEVAEALKAQGVWKDGAPAVNPNNPTGNSTQ